MLKAGHDGRRAADKRDRPIKSAARVRNRAQQVQRIRLGWIGLQYRAVTGFARASSDAERPVAQNSRPPFGTLKSERTSTTAPSSSGIPRVSTSLMNGPIWRGGKFTTAQTCRPISWSGR
jgi:hypothetical protein